MNIWRWFLQGKTVPLPEHDTGDLERAKLERQEAERKLMETRATGAQVSRVSDRSRHIRQQNQFSARIQEAFGRPKHG